VAVGITDHTTGTTEIGMIDNTTGTTETSGPGRTGLPRSAPYQRR
jgi:hypothetical protein